MASNEEEKPPAKTKPYKNWTDGLVPWKDYHAAVSFIASIGIGFTLSASVTLACSSTFQGRGDNTTIASLTAISKILAWGASAYGLALIVSIVTTLLITDLYVVYVLHEESNNIIVWTVKTAFAISALISVGSVIAGIALTGIGLNTIANGSGSMLQWSILAVGLPGIVVALLARFHNNRLPD